MKNASVCFQLLIIYMMSIASASSLRKQIFCPPYHSENTSYSTVDAIPCLIPDICPGVRLYIIDCSISCIGDQFIRLINQDGIEIMSNDNACEAPLNKCSGLYLSPSVNNCVSFTLLQGCYGNFACSGMFNLTYLYDATAMSFQSLTEPKKSMTHSQFANFEFTCPYYSVSRSYSAEIEYAICTIGTVCPGAEITVDDCSQSCEGDQYIQLVNGKF